MNILMCTNYLPASLQKQQDGSFVNEGWVGALVRELLGSDGISLCVMYPQKDSDEPVEEQLSEKCFTFGYCEKDAANSSNGASIAQQVLGCLKKHSFDVVHIMGTEFPHSYYIWQASAEAGMSDRVVVSIQGLVSKCAEHYLTGVPMRYRMGLSVPEIYRGFSSLEKERRGYSARGEYEKKLLSECRWVIGRTAWDKKCVSDINPSIEYRYNSENMRPEFYGDRKWCIDTCEKHSIFVSQATYALKGFHHLLRAMPKILERYPDTVIYAAGACPIHEKSWKRSSYANFLSSLIKKGNLSEHIVFCGRLQAAEMRDRYIKSHVFVSPSNIENSSNSIGEAMLLGVPTVASSVGGTESILSDGTEGLLYPVEDTARLAESVIRIFDDDTLATTISASALCRASALYDRSKNLEELLQIYSDIR